MPNGLKGSVDEANQIALSRIRESQPVLVDIVQAGDAVPSLKDGVLLHAVPPIDWPRMCGPMKGAVIDALRYEGWAATEAEAQAMAAGGEVAFYPAHDSGAVGPMTGIITRSMPVFVIENRTFGNRALCTINEGLGKVMRFGANDDSVIARLGWLQSTVAPMLKEAVARAGSIDLGPLMAQALAMGDEMHQRNVAATSLFFRILAPHLVQGPRKNVAEAIEFMVGNDQFFLNLGMAAAKATMDAVSTIEGSTLVSTMSRNGTDFGIRVSGLGDRWFTAPVLMPQGLYFPGFSSQDANPDMGDSTILETMGLGGFAMAASPAVAGFVGAGTASDAINYTREMGQITLGMNGNLPIPALGFQGTPFGIDMRKVVETGITPVINTGIAHREAGVGQVGAGIVRAPMDCFKLALDALDSNNDARPSLRPSAEGSGQALTFPR